MVSGFDGVTGSVEGHTLKLQEAVHVLLERQKYLP